MKDKTILSEAPPRGKPLSIFDCMPFLPRMAAGLIRLVYGSCRFTILDGEYEQSILLQDGPRLATCWHFAFPTLIYRYRCRGVVVMVSRSRDGEIAARIVKELGFRAFRGSPGKGGSTALRGLIGSLKSSFGGGFIADGSQGPARVAQKGILLLARYTGAPLVPVSMAAKPCWRLRSWDRTVIPKPFSHIVMAFGPPIRVPADASSAELEILRVELETSLNRLTENAEREVEFKAANPSGVAK
jgi:hypothetical protein